MLQADHARHSDPVSYTNPKDEPSRHEADLLRDIVREAERYLTALLAFLTLLTPPSYQLLIASLPN